MADTTLPRPAPVIDPLASNGDGPGPIATVGEGRRGLRRLFEINQRKRDEQAALEAERRAAQEARAELFRRLRREARYYWPLIRNALERLGVYHRVAEKDQAGLLTMMLTNKRSTQTIRKLRTALDPDYIAFEIDTSNLPWHTAIPDLLQPNVEIDLSFVCHCVVKIIPDPTYKAGIWIHVYRDESIAGIPQHLDYLPAYDKLPKKTHPTEFIIGQGPGQLIYHDNLQNVQHILVAGTTGFGKSNWLNTTLVTMCRRNSPDVLKAIVIDLKMGAEMKSYRKLPHITFVKNVDQILPVLRDLHDQLELRMTMLEQDTGTAKNIMMWNRHHSGENRYPYIVVFIDEYAEIATGMQGKERAEAQNLLTRLLQKGRSAGIYFIIATQSPSKTVIGRLVNDNIPARLAFHCATPIQSMLIVGNGEAALLPVKGRAVWANAGVRTQVQAPELTERTMIKLIKLIDEKCKRLGTKPAFDNREVLRYALHHLDGELVRDALRKAFKGTLTDRQITNYLSSIEGTIIDLGNGKEYLVTPAGGQKPRRLMPAITARDNSEDEPEAAQIAREIAARRVSRSYLKPNGHTP